MMKLNKTVNEMDLGDQLILDVYGKTLGLNRTGREIYLQIKKGSTPKEISIYMEDVFGNGKDYMSDIEEYIHKMKAFGIVEEEINE